MTKQSGAALMAAVGLLLFASFGTQGSTSSFSSEHILSTTPVPRELLPQFGTYWLLIGPAGGKPVPPLPCPPMDLPDAPIYSLGDGKFLVDDSAVDYKALREEEALNRTLEVLEFGEMETQSMEASSYSTADLWLELASVTNGAVSFIVHPPELDMQTGVYDLFQTTNLTTSATGLNAANWACMGRTLPGQTNLTIQTITPPESFFRLAGTNDTDGDGLTDAFEKLTSHSNPAESDSDNDGLPDGWEWRHFKTFEETAGGDFDSDGTTNLEEYTQNTDPNSLSFRVQFTSLFVNHSGIAGTCVISQGHPEKMAILVNSTNFAGAQWKTFQTNFIAVIGPDDGPHKVLVALRGCDPNGKIVWDETELLLDTAPPHLVVTNPATFTVARPYLQLRGCADEPLSVLAYTVTNGLGSITNEPAYIIGQEFDTNVFDFTTNYFQAFDVPLAEGINQITLQATDRAGNVSTTNLQLTLDYAQATNPPEIRVLWPPAGVKVAGDTCYIRGTIDDETARVWATWTDAEGLTNSVQGIVERNGMFWLEDLPLLQGSNDLQILVQNAAGRFGTTNRQIEKSEITITITSLPADLYASFGTVAGTISDSGCIVTVNGTNALVNPDGSWFAENVPIIGQGTATFDVTAIPSGSQVPSVLSVQVEKPAAIVVTRHVMKQSIAKPEDQSLWTKNYKAGQREVAEGCWFNEYSADALWSLWGVRTEPGLYRTSVYTWSVTNRLGTWHDSFPGGELFGTMEGDFYAPLMSVPDVQVDHIVEGFYAAYVRHFYARGVRHEWHREAWVDAETLSARTDLRLHTGGKGSVGRQSLHCLDVSATGYGKPASPPWSYTPNYSIPPETIRALSRNVGQDGKLYVALPDNSNPSLNITTSEKHYNAEAGDAKYNLRIYWNESDITEKTSRAVAGQNINLSCGLTPKQGAPPVTAYLWSITGYAISNYVATVAEGKVFEAFPHTNSDLRFCWVDGGMKGLVCSIRVDGHELSSKATFDVFRPNATMTPRVVGEIRADANFLQPGSYLHFGGYSSGTNFVPGVSFQITNMNLPGKYFFVQTGKLRREELWSDGTNYVGLAGWGLDNMVETNSHVYPFDTKCGTYATSDSPAHGLSTRFLEVRVSDSFDMYLMFQATNVTAIPVPLKKVAWSWAASARPVETQSPSWNVVSASPPTNVVSTETVSYPEWQTNLLRLHWSP